jgi:7-carboxy-7-deazaguanine synthase (Cx14CxxC type)
VTYSVKEIYYTLQGEGAQTGRPSVFLRFSGCNLWSGHEADRERAICQFCDTDFLGTNGPGGGRFDSAEALARAVYARWPNSIRKAPYVVCTGGEPLLQLDVPLIAALKRQGVIVAIETNGTIPAPEQIDWICVSPKAHAPLRQDFGDELKLVYPQEDAEPERFTELDFKHFFLQPMDGPNRAENTQAALRYCFTHPQWRLSLQTHKYLGIP